MRTAGRLIVLLGSLIVTVAPAMAHDPLGRAQPSVETTVKGSGLTRAVAIRVRDLDSGNPIPAATLAVRAVDGDGSTVVCDVTRVPPDRFRCSLVFPRHGDWNVQVRIGGNQVVPTSFSVDVRTVGDPRARAASSGGPDVALLVGASLAVLAAAGLGAVLVVRRRRA